MDQDGKPREDEELKVEVKGDTKKYVTDKSESEIRWGDEKNAYKKFKGSECFWYDNKWVKWNCDLDKLMLDEYEDANEMSDEDFVYKEYFGLTNFDTYTKEQKFNALKDKVTNDQYVSKKERENWRIDEAKKEVKRLGCFRKKDNVEEFLWDVCMRDDTNKYFVISKSGKKGDALQLTAAISAVVAVAFASIY